MKQKINLNQVFIIIKKNISFLFLLSMTAGFLALFYNIISPLSYESRFNIVVKKINRLQTEDYQYDDFYALQSINMVSDTVNSWLNGKAVLKNLNPLQNTGFQTAKLASQNIEIILRGKRKQDLIDTEKKIKEFLQKNIENLIFNQENEPCFSVDFLPTALIEQKSKNWQMIIAGISTGFLIGIGYLIIQQKAQKNKAEIKHKNINKSQ